MYLSRKSSALHPYTKKTPKTMIFQDLQAFAGFCRSLQFFPKHQNMQKQLKQSFELEDQRSTK